jgi:CRP/FNR family transcriptional regulator, anaerobic regulatory protein
MADLNVLPVFRNLTDAGRQVLDKGLVRKEIGAATPILHKGSQVSGAYIVTEGRLRVFSIAPSGTEATLYCINPGETCVLALNCLFQDLLYPAWVATEPKTEVAVIPGPIYRKLFEREPTIQNLTVQALSTAVFRLMNELEQVHFCKLEHRLADLILLRASSDGVLRMTQQQMAYHLGTTREVVARIMQAFVAKKFVETQRGLTRIKNSAAMAELIALDGDVAACL